MSDAGIPWSSSCTPGSKGWEAGDYRSLPLAEGFTHTSPFGVVEGQGAYPALVEANEGAFLESAFGIHDALYGDGVASVRYTARKGDFALEAGEWFWGSAGEITGDRLVLRHRRRLVLRLTITLRLSGPS